MRNARDSLCGLLIGLLAVMNVSAEEYDFELDVAFNTMSFDGSSRITTPGGTSFSSSGTDTDELSLLGTWYFKGLSDDKGPRARAVLVDRASSLSFGYSRLEQTNSTSFSSDDPAFPLAPFDLRFDSSGDTFAVDFRYVDRDSGWFGDIGLINTDVTLGGFVDDLSDASGYRLGAGKYLLETTTLSFDVSQLNATGGRDTTAYSVAFEHLGDLGERWDYAIDAGYSRLDTDGGFELDTWKAAIALYPTRDFEFGLGVEHVSGSRIGQDKTALEGFASWFMKPNVRLSARYRVDDTDFPGTVFSDGSRIDGSADQDSFGISATVRF